MNVQEECPHVGEVSRFLREGKVVFFIGAAVSRSSPSNIPLGGELKEKILRSLCEGTGISRIYQTYTRILKAVENLRPEVFFNYLYGVLGQYALQSLNWFQKRPPNFNHYFLAELARQGFVQLILTTNFDSLIEDAAVRIGTRTLVTCFKDADFSLSDFPKIYKFHGTIDQIGTIALTLKQIGTLLPAKKRELLENVLSNNVVVVAGYSGADFDIYPIFLNTKCSKLFWLLKPNTSPSSESTEIISKQRGTWVECDINHFFSELAKVLGLYDDMIMYMRNYGVGYDTIYEEYLKQWASPIPLIKRYAALARILDHVGEYRESIKLYKQMKIIFEIEQNELGVAKVHQRLGFIHIRLGEWDTSIDYLEKALLTLEKFGKSTSLARTYSSLARLYLEKQNLDKAATYYEKALEIYKELKSDQNVRITYMNLSNVYRRKDEYNKAINILERSIKEYNQPHHLAIALHALGLIYGEMKNFEKAIEYEQKSLKILEKIKDVQELGKVYINLGVTYREMGDLEKSILYLNKALSIFQGVEDNVGIAYVLMNLGTIYFIKNERARALEFYYAAKERCMKTKNTTLLNRIEEKIKNLMT